MTSEEKAKALVDIFYKRYAATDTCFGLCNDHPDICDNTGHGCGLWNKYAKESALIVVDEILNDYAIFNENHKSYKVPSFWQLVKTHIQNL